jgi:hypothetical protein
MLVLLVVCLLKLIEMYNNNKMARNKSARNAKENFFGLYNVNQQYGAMDESPSDRYSMKYFYDVDQSCADQLQEFLHQRTGNELCEFRSALSFDIHSSVARLLCFRIPSPWRALKPKVIDV